MIDNYCLDNYRLCSHHFSRLLTLLLCTLAIHVHVQADQYGNTETQISPDPLLLLVGMDEANRRHSFSGLLTYEANGYMSTMRLNQTASNDTVNQRLNFLDGPKRQIVRKNLLSDCDRGTSQSWPRKIEVDRLVKVYDITFDGVERIADREAYAIAVKPRDDHRYGYRFSVDGETGLLLKTLLIANNTVVERLQFIELLLLNGDGQNLLKESDANYDNQVITRLASGSCQSNAINSQWHADWLPEGFLPVDSHVTDHGEQVLVFSDGLATLSVFIADQYESVNKATARYGATVAVILPLKGVDKESMAIVVGEIPMSTARQVAVSLRSR